MAKESEGNLWVDLRTSLPTGTNLIGAVELQGTDASATYRTIRTNESGQIQVDLQGASLSATVDVRLSSDNDSVEAKQATHDNLNLNANLQVANVDVGNANPVPVSDATGSLTIDSGQFPAALTIGGNFKTAIIEELPAGVQNIGDVDILSIAAGDNNIGNVDLVSLPVGNLGQQLSVASLSVTPATDIADATYVGDIKFGESLPAGTNNIGDVDIASIAAGDNNIGNVDLVSLPVSNLGQQLSVASLSTTPATDIADATYVGDIKFGESLPAGTNNIGDVDILSVAAGDNNIGNVDIVSLPAGNLGQQAIAASLSVVPATGIPDATYIGDIKFGESLPAGTNNIGDVDVLSIAAGDNNIGNVDLVSLPSGNLGQQLVAASLSIAPATDIADATYIGDIKFGESLPAGANAIGKLATNSGVDIGDVDILSIAAGDNNIGNVDIASAIPTGSNIIGKVGIDQTTLGTTNRVDIGRVQMVALSPTIASGGTTSTSVDARGFSTFGIVMPAQFTGTAISFEVSDDNATFQALYDASNALVTVTVTASRSYASPTALDVWPYWKIVSNGAEAADRTIKIVGKG